MIPSFLNSGQPAQSAYHRPAYDSNRDICDTRKDIDACDKEKLAKVFKETKEISFRSYHIGSVTICPNDISKKAPLPMRPNTHLHSHAELTKGPLTTPKFGGKTTFSIVNQDSIDAAVEMKERKGLSPCILNLANAFVPGGGVERGSRAQEEDLFRRSNYYCSLYPCFNGFLKRQLQRYQRTQEGAAMAASRPKKRNRTKNSCYLIPEFGGIYSPSVCVFRKGKQAGFACVRKPHIFSFIAVAAYNRKEDHRPRSGLGNGDYGPIDFQAYRNNTKEKIRGILRIAAIHGEQDLILGALGCGAFKNNPKVVADCYAEVFRESEFENRFRSITFAILGKGLDSNFEIFSRHEKLGRLFRVPETSLKIHNRGNNYDL